MCPPPPPQSRPQYVLHVAGDTRPSDATRTSWADAFAAPSDIIKVGRAYPGWHFSSVCSYFATPILMHEYVPFPPPPQAPRIDITVRNTETQTDTPGLPPGSGFTALTYAPGNTFQASALTAPRHEGATPYQRPLHRSSLSATRSSGRPLLCARSCALPIRPISVPK